MRTELFNLGGTPVTLLSIAVFGATLLVTFILAKLARSALTRVLQRGQTERVGVAYAVGRISQYTVFILGVALALDNFGVGLRAIAAVGALLTVGIGFGLQNITQNFISGIILLIERPVQKGDYIVAGGIVGTVVDIEMRATKVVSAEGVAVIVPNSQLITATVINQTQPSSKKRMSVFVSVACDTETARVRDALEAVAYAHPMVLKEPAPKVFFKNFGESALDFELAVWLEHPENEQDVGSDLRFEIDRAFREKKIEIPYPHRDVRILGGALPS